LPRRQNVAELPFRGHKIELQRELVSMCPPPAGAPAGGPPPQVAEVERRGKTLGTFGPMLNVIAAVIIFMMVWKPGL
jgi:hypothetical protein